MTPTDLTKRLREKFNQTCPTCGTPVRVVGHTTHSYESAHEKLLALVSVAVNAVASMDTAGGDCMTCEFDGYLYKEHSELCPWIQLQQALDDLKEL